MPDLPTIDQSQPDQAPQQDQEETVRFSSSWLSEGTYSKADKTLSLTFQKGGEVAYSGVPPEVWENLKRSPSPGRYFGTDIQHRYPWN